MISYRKGELEDLAHAIGLHWGGEARDWRLVVEPASRRAAPAVMMHVEIALGACTRITTVPLGNTHDDSAPYVATQSAAQRGLSHAEAVAAVRRASVRALLAQSSVGDIEPLLGYLRGCGILVLD